jgi:hypothetical protein
MRGLMVLDEFGLWRVYVICESSSHCYYVMTKSAFMPSLTGELI